MAFANQTNSTTVVSSSGGFCCETPGGGACWPAAVAMARGSPGRPLGGLQGVHGVYRGSRVSPGGPEGPGGLQVYVVAHVGDVDQACLDVCHIFLCYKIRYHLVWATHLLLSSTQVHTRWSAGESPAAHE